MWLGFGQEWDQAEIDDFTRKFWPADIFFDESKKIFTSLTDGKETKLGLAQMLNPFSAAWKAARKAKQTVTDHNLKVRTRSASSCFEPQGDCLHGESMSRLGSQI